MKRADVRRSNVLHQKRAWAKRYSGVLSTLFAIFGVNVALFGIEPFRR
ncbi:MAG: hypothetical protein WB014_03015 [Methanosarcina sp.]